MFDYSSQMSAQYINSGIIDNFRIPKRAYYWYRNANLNVAPPTWPRRHGRGLEAHVEHHDALRGGGTQDAWLYVTVVDASGTAISNTATVTLTIKSGPGEFPTGRASPSPTGWRLGVGHRDSRRPSRHRVSDLLRRHDSHRGYRLGLD